MDTTPLNAAQRRSTPLNAAQRRSTPLIAAHRRSSPLIAAHRRSSPLIAAHRRCMLALTVFGAVSVPSFFAPEHASAAVGDCTASTQVHLNTNEHRPFKVDLGVGFAGMSNSEALGAIVAGALEWNESAGAGTFEFSGTVSEPSGLDATQADCIANDRNYNLVKVYQSTLNISQSYYDTNPGIFASTVARCDDASGHGTRFEVRIFISRMNGAVAWGNRTADPTAIDLMGVTTHEFGHTYNLGHVSANEGAMMGVQATGRSELYQWDFRCSRIQGGSRNLKAYRRYHQSSGGLGSEAYFSGANQVTQACAGLTKTGGLDDWSAAFNRVTAISWNLNFYTANSVDLPGISQYNTSGLRVGMWREQPSSDWVSYSYYQDSTPYDTNAPHHVRILNSSNDFASHTVNTLVHCTSMTGFLTCSNTAPVTSAGGIATGWLGSPIGRTVTVWANQNRQNDIHDGEIMVAVGKVNDATLPVPHATGIRAAGSPSIACQEDFYGTYDCLIEYTPREIFSGASRIVQVSIGTPTNTYPVTISNLYTVVNSGRYKSTALWRSSTDGKFYIAIPSSNLASNVGVYTTVDGGISWSSVGNYGTAITGATTASTWRGASHPIVYAK